MVAFLTVVYVLVSFFMVIIVLLQQGKGSGMGAAFGGGGQTMFGGRGQTTPLQKLTTIMAILFMVLSVALASLSGRHESDLWEASAKPGEEAGFAPAAPEKSDTQETADKTESTDQAGATESTSPEATGSASSDSSETPKQDSSAKSEDK